MAGSILLAANSLQSSGGSWQDVHDPRELRRGFQRQVSRAAQCDMQLMESCARLHRGSVAWQMLARIALMVAGYSDQIRSACEIILAAGQHWNELYLIASTLIPRSSGPIRPRPTHATVENYLDHFFSASNCYASSAPRRLSLLLFHLITQQAAGNSKVSTATHANKAPKSRSR